MSDALTPHPSPVEREMGVDALERVRRAAIVVYAACLPISVSGAQIALGVLLAVRLVDLVRKRPAPFGWLDAALVTYLGWTVVTVFFSTNLPRSLTKLPGAWVHLAWFALVPALAHVPTRRRALRAMAATAALMGLYAAAQWRWGDAVPRVLAEDVTLWQKHGGHNLAVGLFDHHLTFGNTMVLCLGAILAAGSAARRKAYWIVAGALALPGVVFSYARGAWIALALMFAVWAYRMGRRAFIAVAAAGVVAVALGAVASPTLRDRMASTVRSGSNLERIYIWKTSLAMAVDHPWTGIGPGVYRTVVDEYRRGYNIKWTTKAHAHNSYFMAAAESGWPGGVAMTLLVLAALRLGRRAATRAGPSVPGPGAGSALWACLIGFSVATFFQHNMGDAEVAAAFWWVCALAWTLATSPAPEEEWA